jgi:hypothetical protein
MKTYGGNGGIAPAFLNTPLEVRGQLHASAALSPKKKLPETIVYEAEWAPEPIWTLWRRQKSLASAGIRAPVVKPVTMPVELSRHLPFYFT